jgi:hypothetical protein
MTTQLLLFIAVALALAGQLLDVITTEVALSHGWTETVAAPLAVLKKLGSTVLAVVKIVGLGIVVPLLTAIIELHFNAPGYLTGSIVGFVSAAVGFYAGIKNYILLKAAKISIF